MWVYTPHGEEVGRLHGVSRPAGQQAMLGYEPVDGVIAKAWEKRGYIEWKEDLCEAENIQRDLRE